MNEVPSATDVARTLGAALESAGLPHAIGGAIAYGFYGPPRATFDVDVNVFVPPAEVDRVVDALSAVAAVDRDHARKTAQERGDFIGREGCASTSSCPPRS